MLISRLWGPCDSPLGAFLAPGVTGWWTEGCFSCQPWLLTGGTTQSHHPLDTGPSSSPSRHGYLPLFHFWESLTSVCMGIDPSYLLSPRGNLDSEPLIVYVVKISTKVRSERGPECWHGSLLPGPPGRSHPVHSQNLGQATPCSVRWCPPPVPVCLCEFRLFVLTELGFTSFHLWNIQHLLPHTV